ncbi:MAG: nucleoside deaminase [Chloroflexi bacterium]|nr:nucleoside deaminase [Chloroflexota bacterium]
MATAIDEARAAAGHGDVPIGAVVVRDGEVVARGRNRREADGDPTAHAEILALREAARTLGRWRLQDCALYVTVEPCAMCAGAAILARLPLIVFGAPEEKTGAVRSTVDLFDDPRALHRPKWRMGARREEIERMLGEFFSGRRGPREVEGEGISSARSSDMNDERGQQDG